MTLLTTLIDLINSLRYTVFTQRTFSHFAEKNRVFLSTLEAPREKTVHLWELVIYLKVVVNFIFDIIHFDQNTVRSNLKELCKI